ncbi:MAG: hypothetical protein HQ517_14840, partial [SAR324 cluster bacterium]|nr:hypothetical protein [SAR324 cluster bacterium]
PVKSKTVEPVKSKTVEPVKTVGTPQILLDTDEISTIKEMISRFRRGHLNMMPVENFELIELKHALRHFGVDYKTILDHFRKSSDN